MLTLDEYDHGDSGSPVVRSADETSCIVIGVTSSFAVTASSIMKAVEDSVGLPELTDQAKAMVSNGSNQGIVTWRQFAEFMRTQNRVAAWPVSCMATSYTRLVVENGVPSEVEAAIRVAWRIDNYLNEDTVDFDVAFEDAGARRSLFAFGEAVKYVFRQIDDGRLTVNAPLVGKLAVIAQEFGDEISDEVLSPFLSLRWDGGSRRVARSAPVGAAELANELVDQLQGGLFAIKRDPVRPFLLPRAYLLDLEEARLSRAEATAAGVELIRNGVTEEQLVTGVALLINSISRAQSITPTSSESKMRSAERNSFAEVVILIAEALLRMSDLSTSPERRAALLSAAVRAAAAATALDNRNLAAWGLAARIFDKTHDYAESWYMASVADAICRIDAPGSALCEDTAQSCGGRFASAVASNRRIWSVLGIEQLLDRVSPPSETEDQWAYRSTPLKVALQLPTNDDRCSPILLQEADIHPGNPDLAYWMLIAAGLFVERLETNDQTCDLANTAERCLALRDGLEQLVGAAQ